MTNLDNEHTSIEANLYLCAIGKWDGVHLHTTYTRQGCWIAHAGHKSFALSRVLDGTTDLQGGGALSAQSLSFQFIAHRDRA